MPPGWKSRAITAPSAAFVAAGARLAPLTVGAAGWRLDPPAGAEPRLIYVTPSCQHPLGVTMPMDAAAAS